MPTTTTGQPAIVIPEEDDGLILITAAQLAAVHHLARLARQVADRERPLTDRQRAALHAAADHISEA